MRKCLVLLLLWCGLWALPGLLHIPFGFAVFIIDLEASQMIVKIC